MRFVLAVIFSISTFILFAQNKIVQLKPEMVFDGETLHSNWVVLVKGNTITYAGIATEMPSIKIDSTILLPGQTLMPGIIEGHSHLFLHPYNETEWNDQVLKESRAERMVRAVNHARATLLAGVTTVRDLGTEGAGYDDVGLKKSIENGLTPGPRMIVAGRAIVAKGSYGPKSDNTELSLIVGAEETGGPDVINTVRDQIGHGVDLIKIYADYGWGLKRRSVPTFTIAEIKEMVATASSTGRPVVAHASTKEGMRRAIEGGVETIEHGDNGDDEIFKLMKLNDVALCATIAAGDAVSTYSGWKKGQDADPERIVQKKKSFKAALDQKVTIAFGGDVGVYAHGDNMREMELMVDYGMAPIAVLQSATAVNAKVFHQQNLGQIKVGFLADIIAVRGNPVQNISAMRNVNFVMKDGVQYK